MNSCPITRNLNVIFLALTLLNIPATHGESQTLVLSIFTDNLGVASPSETHLYATVTEGGTMTYADITENRIVDRKRVLTTVELSKLREVFTSSQLTSLHGTISGGKFDLVTTRCRWKLSFCAAANASNLPSWTTTERKVKAFPPGRESCFAWSTRFAAQTIEFHGDAGKGSILYRQKLRPVGTRPIGKRGYRRDVLRFFCAARSRDRLYDNKIPMN